MPFASQTMQESTSPLSVKRVCIFGKWVTFAGDSSEPSPSNVPPAPTHQLESAGERSRALDEMEENVKQFYSELQQLAGVRADLSRKLDAILQHNTSTSSSPSTPSPKNNRNQRRFAKRNPKTGRFESMSEKRRNSASSDEDDTCEDESDSTLRNNRRQKKKNKKLPLAPLAGGANTENSTRPSFPLVPDLNLDTAGRPVVTRHQPQPDQQKSVAEPRTASRSTLESTTTAFSPSALPEAKTQHHRQHLSASIGSNNTIKEAVTSKPSHSPTTLSSVSVSTEQPVSDVRQQPRVTPSGSSPSMSSPPSRSTQLWQRNQPDSDLEHGLNCRHCQQKRYFDDRWDDMLHFYNAHQTLPEKYGRTQEERNLGFWLGKLLTEHNSGRRPLYPDQLHRLEKIGIFRNEVDGTCVCPP